MVTHDLPMILKYAHRVGIMKDGVLLEVATTENIQKNQNILIQLDFLNLNFQ